MPKIDVLQQISQIAKQNSQPLKKNESPKFADTLKAMINQVDELQKASGQSTKDFIAGKNIDLHEVMAAGQEAQLSFQFMMEMRNKLLEAYQEVNRMPV